VPDEEYDSALAAVTEAARRYRGGVIEHPGDSSRRVWSPIYAELLAELEAQLLVAGHRYDRIAENRDVPVSQRFDWRGQLGQLPGAPAGTSHQPSIGGPPGQLMP
jgi:hypothetical protein